MAGKSTFLRQNALIAILAQMGSYVPAGAAHIGVVDRLFSRVGAADDLARGRSTFMVEMVETAAILNQAGPRRWLSWMRSAAAPRPSTGCRSPGRAVEHLHEVNRCRALFATHFHELTALAAGSRQLPTSRMQGQGMAGRRDLSARSGARCSRPVLRHSGGQAGRIASGVVERAAKCWNRSSKATSERAKA